MKVLLTVSYDGYNYCGWQRQKNDKTIQGEIEKALKKIYKKEILTLGASRTDAKVHALDQKVMFKLEESYIPINKLALLLNRELDEDIYIKESLEVDDRFHPIAMSKGKTYEYKILNDKYLDPVHRRYVAHVERNLDVGKMQNAGRLFLGTHDFTSFSTKQNNTKSPIRTIYNFEIKKEGNFLIIRVVGNGFLYNMVRIMVGTLIDVGLGKKDVDDINTIFESRNRMMAGKTASANGLTLVKVHYDNIL